MMLRLRSFRRSSDAYSVVRLARTGRSGDQKYAVRPLDRFGSSSRSVAGAMPSWCEIELAGLFVEQAQHDALAVAGRNRRHAHVDRTAGDAQADAAVLRQAFLGDVELAP